MQINATAIQKKDKCHKPSEAGFPRGDSCGQFAASRVNLDPSSSIWLSLKVKWGLLLGEKEGKGFDISDLYDNAKH